MPKSDQEKAEKLYIEGGSSYATLAKKFKVSVRTVKRWAESGNWQVKKKSEEIASQAIASEVSEMLQRPVQAEEVRPHLAGVSPQDIVVLALAACHADLEDPDIRSRTKGEVINSIERLLKLQHQQTLYKYEIELKQLQVEIQRADLELKHRQLHPPTARAWAEFAIEWGHDMGELIGSLYDVVELPRPPRLSRQDN